jgi:hypothetical protein
MQEIARHFAQVSRGQVAGLGLMWKVQAGFVSGSPIVSPSVEVEMGH